MREILNLPRQNANTYVAGYKIGFAAGLKVRLVATQLFVG